MKGFKIILLLILVVLVTGCNDLTEHENDRSYEIRERAVIDHYEITMNGYTYKDNILTVEYTITNNDNTEHTIDNDNFDLVIDDVIQTKDLNNFEPIKLPANDTKNITISYVVEQRYEDDYDILFYSKVVTNNILFEIDL